MQSTMSSNLTVFLPLRLSLILQVSWNGVLIMVRWRWWCHSFDHFDLRSSPPTLLSHSFSIIWYGVSLICFLSCLFWHFNNESSRKKVPRAAERDCSSQPVLQAKTLYTLKSNYSWIPWQMCPCVIDEHEKNILINCIYSEKHNCIHIF